MKTLGIRKETKNRWEIRVPLNPRAVKELVDKGYTVRVQPSANRVYHNDEYAAAGAVLTDDLAGSDVILGVKEVPIDDIDPGMPYLFFSHVIKGQDYNMPLLQKFLDTRSTLLDYEKIIDDKGRRLVFFGKFAGNAGMVDTLWGLGRRLKLHHGLDTPFLKLKRAYEYDSVQDAVNHLAEIGREIEQNGLPAEICPFNIFLLGYGHVATGCREILSALPIREIEPGKLATLEPGRNRNNVFLTVFKEEHLVERKDGAGFNLQDYYDHGASYKSRMESYLPFCSVYVNAIYWAPGYPVFLGRNEMARLQGPHQKLVIIGDITCDINGSVQATVKSTEPDIPIFIYNANTGEAIDGLEGEGFADCAVDNLPCEFAREASDYFSSTLMPFLERMLDADYTQSLRQTGLPREIQNACIVHHGKLEPDFDYLNEYLD
ncbi:MAG: hypothetical protein K8R90_07320 [Candidatus Cloacimonetes bacterium]|nr:hypothetical protein [Candidatus Cloacimonadota bacterium]